MPGRSSSSSPVVVVKLQSRTNRCPFAVPSTWMSYRFPSSRGLFAASWIVLRVSQPEPIEEKDGTATPPAEIDAGDGKFRFAGAGVDVFGEAGEEFTEFFDIAAATLDALGVILPTMGIDDGEAADGVLLFGASLQVEVASLAKALDDEIQLFPAAEAFAVLAELDGAELVGAVVLDDAGVLYGEAGREHFTGAERAMGRAGGQSQNRYRERESV